MGRRGVVACPDRQGRVGTPVCPRLGTGFGAEPHRHALRPRPGRQSPFRLHHRLPQPPRHLRSRHPRPTRGLRLLWVEDLGETDLGNLAGTDWNDSRFPAYVSALRTVFPLHCLTEDAPPADLPELERPFDESLYQWEQTYFLTHYVERFHSPELAAELREHPSLTELARDLAGHRRSLVHRDFQSTNVMLRGGSSYLIDYQGLRWACPNTISPR